MASVPSLPQENGKEDLLGRSSPLSMPCETGPRNPSDLPLPSHHIMQDDPLQSATLVPPLASAFPPMGPNAPCVPYIPNFTVPPHCVAPQKIIMNGGPNGLMTEADLDVEEDKKPDKEHKKRSKNWTRPETLKLIRLRTELAPKFVRTGRKSELWERIANALHQDQFIRDAQQCRDKWEKLMAGYKEVKDGLKEREDNPFYEELHPLLSGKSSRRERDNPVSQHSIEMHDAAVAGAQQSPSSAFGMKEPEKEGPSMRTDGSDEDDDVAPEERSSHKRKRSPKYVAVTDLQAVQTLLEMVSSRQQKILKDFLDTLEQQEQQREQTRQEREEKWRAEELAQSRIFNHAMIVLTQKLVGESTGATASGLSAPIVCNPPTHQGPMKRSKNWKRVEVLQLIKLRGEMEIKFSKSTRRAALWDELSNALGTQGIKRDGKQCREKWDKLMSEYKDVLDGKREQGDSPYFQELTAAVEARPGEAG